jgi:hypothetical protein
VPDADDDRSAGGVEILPPVGGDDRRSVALDGDRKIRVEGPAEDVAAANPRFRVRHPPDRTGATSSGGEREPRGTSRCIDYG